MLINILSQFNSIQFNSIQLILFYCVNFILIYIVSYWGSFLLKSDFVYIYPYDIKIKTYVKKILVQVIIEFYNLYMEKKMLKFYYNTGPNPMKVALCLEEMGLDYEAIPVDKLKGE